MLMSHTTNDETILERDTPWLLMSFHLENPLEVSESQKIIKSEIIHMRLLIIFTAIWSTCLAHTVQLNIN